MPHPEPSDALQPPPPPPMSPARYVLGGTAIVAMMVIAIMFAGREIYFGSQNVSFIDDGASARILARRALELKIVPRIPEAELRAIVDRLRAKAADGDAKAALFVFELAKAQAEDDRRVSAPPGPASATPAQP